MLNAVCLCCGLQIATDEAAELPAADAVTIGGENASERRCTFLDLALYLSSGLDASAIAILYKAIKPIMQVCPKWTCSGLPTPSVGDCMLSDALQAPLQAGSLGCFVQYLGCLQLPVELCGPLDEFYSSCACMPGLDLYRFAVNADLVLAYLPFLLMATDHDCSHSPGRGQSNISELHTPVHVIS